MSGGPQALNFAAQVDDWVRESKTRLTAVFRQSTQDVVEEMQKVGPSVASTRAAISRGLGTTGRGRNRKQISGPVKPPGEGGKMPVDTGFLRASLRISTAGPVFMSDRPEAGAPATYDEAAAVLAISGSQIGDTVYATYSAVYAARVNYGFVGTDSAGRTYNQRGYHFVELAALKWPQIVEANVNRLRAMSEGAGTL